MLYLPFFYCFIFVGRVHVQISRKIVAVCFGLGKIVAASFGLVVCVLVSTVVEIELT